MANFYLDLKYQNDFLQIANNGQRMGYSVPKAILPNAIAYSILPKAKPKTFTLNIRIFSIRGTYEYLTTISTVIYNVIPYTFYLIIARN